MDIVEKLLKAIEMFGEIERQSPTAIYVGQREIDAMTVAQYSADVLKPVRSTKGYEFTIKGIPIFAVRCFSHFKVT